MNVRPQNGNITNLLYFLKENQINSIVFFIGCSRLKPSKYTIIVVFTFQAGSCVERLSSIPFMFCNMNGVCTYARSYWLSTEKNALIRVNVDMKNPLHLLTVKLHCMLLNMQLASPHHLFLLVYISSHGKFL